MEPRKYYQDIIDGSNCALSRLRKESFFVAMSRLAVFVATVVACFVAEASALVAVVAVCGLVLFLWLAKLSGRIDGRKSVEEMKIERSRLNIDRLDLKFDNLPEGSAYIDPAHDYAFDIDLFGKKSLFSLLDSTSTAVGSRKLADWLLHPEKVSSEVEERQAAVKELSENNGFRLKMASIGKIADDETSGDKTFDAAKIPDFSVNAVWRAAYRTVPFVYAALFALMALDLLPGIFIFYFFLLVLAASGLQAKRVGKLHGWLAKSVRRMAGCSELLRAIENERFSSGILLLLQSNVRQGGSCASRQTSRLMRIINNLDQRYNVFGYAIMNGFFYLFFTEIGKGA